MNKKEIFKKISIFKDIYNRFGGKIGLYILDKKVFFFVENSKFGTPNEIKLNKYDFLYYFTNNINLSNELLTQQIYTVLTDNKHLL